MVQSKRTFGLFKTEVKALELLNEKEKHEAAGKEIYEASGSRGHPKYVIDSLSKKGLVEPSKVSSNWKLTVDGYKKLQSYYANQAKIGELNI